MRAGRSSRRVLIALAIALAIVPAACGDKAVSREAELGSYAELTPKHGVYIRVLTPAGERWRATYNVEDEHVEIRGAWQKEGSKKIVMVIGGDPNAKLWAIVTEVLAAPNAPWTHSPDLEIEIAISDGDKAKVIKTHGPFTDGPAKRLFEGIKGWVPDPDDPANKVN